MYQQLPDWSTDLVPKLNVDRPHLWQVSLLIATISENKFQELRATLSPDELAKADRFYDPLDGHRYIIARGTLRSILSHYLHLDPCLIKFTYTPQGKPLLDRTFSPKNPQTPQTLQTNLSNLSAPPNIQFNLSHSQDLAVYAVALDRPLGIDVEYLRPLKDALSLAKRWFTPKEYAEILQHSDPTKTFFRFWTAKEAYLKATGAGLRHLSQVEIFTNPDGSLQLRDFPYSPNNSPNNSPDNSPDNLQSNSQDLDNLELNNPVYWSIEELVPAPGYVGALAIPDNLTIPKNPEIPEFWGMS